ncbi:7-hydroxymethyl chlorophyll a reductase [Durusdinium trenchii]|uniref:Chloroplastic n=1 Tax=Durusdinium trenchii TaxID=1381693 RepID=A0ABP0M323_9DINO
MVLVPVPALFILRLFQVNETITFGCPVLECRKSNDALNARFQSIEAGPPPSAAAKRGARSKPTKGGAEPVQRSGTRAQRLLKASVEVTKWRSERAPAEHIGRAQARARCGKKGKPMPVDQSVYPAKELCSRCGFCNTSLIAQVQDACAFLGAGMARIDQLEHTVHGRPRQEEELYFGVQDGLRPIQVAPEARTGRRAWTGVVTSIACEMLRSKAVDAVLCVSSTVDKPLEPKPILARSVEEVLQTGGVKPMLSPNLLPLEELWQVRGEDIQRLLFIGVGCQVQALRSVEADLGLKELYVLGTNCVDNPRNAEALHRFLQSASETPETATGFEFMQDNRIHVKHSDGRYERIPVFSLKEPQNCTGVIAKSCYSCFDYVNALTDLTVGYMGVPWQGGRMTEHQQYCVVRNERGQKMLRLSQSVLELGQAEELQVDGRLSRQQLLPEVLRPELDLAFGQRKPRPEPPRWLAELLSEVFTWLGPQGLDFARASIDRATLRNLVCLEVDLLKKRAGQQMELDATLPKHAKKIRSQYQELFETLLETYRGKQVQ